MPVWSLRRLRLSGVTTPKSGLGSLAQSEEPLGPEVVRPGWRLSKTQLSKQLISNGGSQLLHLPTAYIHKLNLREPRNHQVLSTPAGFCRLYFRPAGDQDDCPEPRWIWWCMRERGRHSTASLSAGAAVPEQGNGHYSSPN
jgi:hypothetical protein